MNEVIAHVHLWLNSYHSAGLDQFMVAYSQSVNWYPVALCIVCLLFPYLREKDRGVRYCISIGLAPTVAQLIATVIVQPIKYLVNEARPVTFFAQNYPEVQLPLADGVRMNYWLSFPSGHTATFFAMAVSLIFYLNHYLGQSIDSPKKIKTCKYIYSAILIILAIIGGYSRIYLSQHFLHDVLAGAGIGIFAAWMAQLICSTQAAKTE